MSIRTRIAALGRTLFRGTRLDADLDAEVRGYLDALAERKVREGLEPAAARRAALIETGGIEQVKERTRDARLGRAIDTVLQDVRHGVRSLGRAPGFTAAALTLALGVGANTAIFSIVDTVLLRPAPVRDLDRLVMLWETDRQSGTMREPASVPDYLDFRARARRVSPVVGLVPAEVTLAGPDGDASRLAALRVSRELLPTLGFQPIVGRSFTAEEDRVGGPNVLLISESLWASAFNRDRAVQGRTLTLNDVPFEVVGVVHDVADFGVLQVLTAAAYSRAFTDRGDRMRVDAWLPLQADPRAPRETHGIFVFGTLAEGVSRAAAQQEFDAIGRDLERAYQGSNRARGVHVEALGDVVFGPVRQGLILLLAASAFVLVAACINVATLLLARGATRACEAAVRSALGAGTARLIRQFAIENLVLAFGAGGIGVALAYAGLKALISLAPSDIPRLADAAIDGRVLGVMFGLLAAVGLVFGLVPGLQARRLDLHAALGDAGEARIAGARRARRQRSVLVVAEVALAVVLLAGAGLLIRSFWRLESVDPGFRTGGVLKAEYQMPRSRYPVDFSRFPDFEEINALTSALERAAARLPGVQAAAVAGNHPLDPGFTNSFVIVGRETESSAFPEICVRRVTAGYFRTTGLSLRRGRLLEERDATRAPAVMVINEAAARRFFPGSDPIGARIRFWGASRTIVGVVADERFHGLAEAPPIAVYTPLVQTPSANGAGVLLVRTGGDPLALAGAVRKVFREQDRELAVFGIEPLDRTLSRSLSSRRFLMVLLVLFAAVALALATVGIDGVLAYGVAQRRREFGIRMALGASPRHVWYPVIREAFALTAAGLAIGLCGALVLSRFLATYLFGIAPSDPVTFVLVTVFLGAVGAIASVIPARRATKVDPTVALRAE